VIARPSCSQLVDAVRAELRTTVVPAVTDPQAIAALQMADWLLGVIAVRAEHEIGWMREEITEIGQLSEAVLAAGLDTSGAVAAALERQRAEASTSQHAGDVQREYDRAGDVLAEAIDATSAAPGPIRDAVQTVLTNRLERELRIRGQFALAGRQ